MLKSHKLFLNGENPKSFDKVIVPTDMQWQYLVEAKNSIRDHLRSRFRTEIKRLTGMDHSIGPRFRSQGSCVYRTLVQPAHLGQEMDWDFGVYLPVEIMDERPKTAAKTYFELVENALGDLCIKKKWLLDRSIDKCVRVKIASWAHIDVPLYAVPANEFHTIQEQARFTARFNDTKNLRDSTLLSESIEFDEMPDPMWQLIEGVHLATRDGEWLKTDPESVAHWFNDRIVQHGDQLRRVCRYIKSWRDYHWPDSDCKGPSSVSLMILVTSNFVRRLRRDDLALEDAARTISERIRENIYEPGIDGGIDDFNRLDETKRIEAKKLADELLKQLRISRNYRDLTKAQDVIRNIRSQFGDRIANETSFVELDYSPEIVRSSKPKYAPPPLVGSNKSG